MHGRQFLAVACLLATYLSLGILIESHAKSAWASEIPSSTNSAQDQAKPCSALQVIPPAVEAEMDLRQLYLARVRARISKFWIGPPVDISGKALTVTVRFRLERDGRVGAVTIERSSGNDYYDMAAQRAVQSAMPVPPFPPSMKESYLDSSFTFSVGEQSSSKDPSVKNVPDTQATPEKTRLAEEARLAEKHLIDTCRNYLDDLFRIIEELPATQAGLDELKQMIADVQLARKKLNSTANSDLQSIATELYQNMVTRREKIEANVTDKLRLQQFDSACDNTLNKATFPSHLRDQKVGSKVHETRTLGRVFCTAVNGGGTVEYRVTDGKPPSFSLSVKTNKRSFVLILQKKMQDDLTEEWIPVEVQTPSDRKSISSSSSNSFMHRFPQLVSQ